MSYDPSHHKPRHAGRMPQVITPEEAWPALDGAAYPDGAGYQDGGQGTAGHLDGYWSAAGYQKYQNPSYQDAYPGYGDHAYHGASSGYRTSTNGYHQTGNDYPRASYGYTGSTDAYHGNADDWDGWAMDADGYHGGGAAGYQDYDDYAEPVVEDPRLMAPDAGLVPGGWRAGRGAGERRGLIVGAVTGFLAAGMAIGVATLAAAFVRPQASPIIAVGEAFIDHTPSGLKNFAIQRFGENDKTMLLLGMYVAIALLAMGIGILARRTATLGVVGIAAFSLFGAYVAITRPASRASDVIPSVIGGIAGVAALLWLERASAPVKPSPRPAQHGRRAR